MGFVNLKILPFLDNEQQLCDSILSLVERMPDTFVLSRENPLDNLTDKVKEIMSFYKTMSKLPTKSTRDKLALSIKQREAIGHHRRLRTEIYISNTYIETRRKQLEQCLKHLYYIEISIADIRLWLTDNPNTLIERQLELVAGGYDSYSNSCSAFNDSISLLDTSVAAVTDFLQNLLPAWDAQISRSENISKGIEAELKQWE